MLDLQFVCDNLETIRANCQHRHVEADLDGIVSLRDRRSMLITEADKVRHEQKETSALIPKAAPADKQVLVEKGRAMRERIAPGAIDGFEKHWQVKPLAFGTRGLRAARHRAGRRSFREDCVQPLIG